MSGYLNQPPPPPPPSELPSPPIASIDTEEDESRPSTDSNPSHHSQGLKAPQSTYNTIISLASRSAQQPFPPQPLQGEQNQYRTQLPEPNSDGIEPQAEHQEYDDDATPTKASSTVRSDSVEEGVVRTNVGGRIKLNKHTPHKRRLDERMEDDEVSHEQLQRENGGEGSQGYNYLHEGDRKEMYDKQEEEEEGEEEDFDPTAQVAIFDSQSALVVHWNACQTDLVPFVQDFVETIIEMNFTLAHSVVQQYHLLNARVQKDLTAGVESIEAEEKKHEDIRKMIADFSGEMRKAAERLDPYRARLAMEKGTVQDGASR